MKRSKIVAPIVAVLLFALLVPCFVIATAGSEQNADMRPYDAIARLDVLPQGQEGVYITRYEALTKILWVMGELYDAEEYTSAKSFEDATRDQVKVLGYAERKGVIVGDGEGFFYPDKLCTLEDMLIMIMRVLGYSDVTAENVYTLAEDCGIYKYSQADDLYFHLNGGRAAECIWNMLAFAIDGETSFADLLIEKSILDGETYSELFTTVSYKFGDTTAVETKAETDKTAATETTNPEEETTTAPETTKPVEETTTYKEWTDPWKPPF